MERDEILAEGWENPMFKMASQMAELLGCSEQEALEVEEQRGFGLSYFIKNGYSMSYPDTFGTTKNSLRIYGKNGDRIFAGEIETIEDFRKICNELKING